MRRIERLGLALIFVFLVQIPFSAGQAAPGVFADATHPSGPPDPTKLDTIWQVDPITGSLSVTVPFTTVPTGGRGPRIPFSLHYNSSSTVTLQTDGSSVVPGVGSGLIGVSSVPQIIEYFRWAAGSINQFPVSPLGPWTTSGPYQYSSGSVVPDQNYTVNPGQGNQINYTYGKGCPIIGPFIYVDESGASHDLNLEYDNAPTSSPSPPCSDAISATATYGSSYFTTDGSALLTSSNLNGHIGVAQFNGGYPSVIYPDGTAFSRGVLEDSNGNQAWIGQDGIGRTTFSTTIPINRVGQIPAGSYSLTTNGPSGSEPYAVTFGTVSLGSFNMPHPSGTSEMHDLGFCVGSLTCATSFSASQVAAGHQNTSFSAITSITLPNGTGYSFQYDGTYGTLSRISFPTGGYVRFQWGIRSDGGGYGQFDHLSTLVVTDAYVSAGSGEEHWHYDFPSYSAGLTSTVTSPDGSYSTYTGAAILYGAVPLFQTGAAPSWKVGTQATYNGNGTLVKSVTTAWDAYSQSPSDGLPTLVTTTYYGGTSAMQQQVKYVYDSYANVIEKDESDFYGCTGSPCPPASTPSSGWIRKTYTSYQYQSSSSWVLAHIVNKPSQVLITDGSGHPYSLTEYGYDETAVSGSAGYVNHDDSNYGRSSTFPRGNLTTEMRCKTLTTSTTVTPASASTACSEWLSTTHTYDLTGQLTSTVDPNGNQDSFSYADNYSGTTPPSATNGYVTQITHPYGYTDKYSYYYSSGQLASHSDWNSQTTTYTYSDLMNRLTGTSYPDTGGVQITYSDSDPPSVTVSTTTGEAAPAIIRKTEYDGLGRVSQTQLTTDPNGTDYVDTNYDGNGRVYSVSNPYRSTDTVANTVYSPYDAADRPLTVTNPDGTSKSYSYPSNTTVTTDENGNQWLRTTNGLGQLVVVKEPNGSTHSPSLETDYGYDPLGNLLAVTQKGIQGTSSPVYRSFAYNGVSWLLAANNPENASAANPPSRSCAGTAGGSLWTACYVYDGDGNVLSRVDNRVITTLYSYDALNRLISKMYSNDASATPFACYQYGSTTNSAGYLVGRLMNAWTQRSTAGSCPAAPIAGNYLTLRSITTYDSIGRIKNEKQCTPANCTSGTAYQPAYTYDLAGLLSTYTNGISSTPTVGTLSFANTYDGAGRLLKTTSNWSDGTHPSSIFSAQSPQSTPCQGSSSPTYAAFGGLQNAAFGSGLTLNRTYTNRLWTACEIDTGSLVASPTAGSATVIITGTEQSK